jgi:hypothetical protein
LALLALEQQRRAVTTLLEGALPAAHVRYIPVSAGECSLAAQLGM